MKNRLLSIVLMASVIPVRIVSTFDRVAFARSIAVLQELKSKNKLSSVVLQAGKQKKHKSRSQTQAYLSVSWLRRAVEQDFGTALVRLRPLITKILNKEAALADTHYVFYHGQESTHRLIQDVIKQLYQALALNNLPKDFIYLRMPSTFFDSKLTPDQFIDQCTAHYGPAWNDLNLALVPKLLSLNVSLFGNITRRLFGECSFEFFLHSASIHSFDKSKLLEDFFNAYNFDKALLFDAQELLSLLRTTREGQLLQIAVKKERIDDYVYLSQLHGVPYNHVIMPDYFDKTRKRHTNIGPLLDLYKTQPEAISALDTLQARLFITSDRALQPTGDIKIYRYSTLKKKQKHLYKTKLKLFIEKLLATWTEKNSLNRFFMQYPLGRLAFYRTVFGR